MKTLLIVRHAKSSWKDSSMLDIDRPLNQRGRDDAPFMGTLLHNKKVKPETIITSPAKRAHTTAKLMAEKMNFDEAGICVSDEMYLADVNDLMEVVHSIDNNQNVAMLVGHNPGLTNFSNHIANFSMDNIPTCGIVCVEFAVDSWNKAAKKNSRVVFFEYPKKH